MPRSQRLLLLTLCGLLACGEDPPGPPPSAAAKATPTPAVRGVAPPQGFVAMDPADVQRIRSATVRGEAIASELDAWVAAEGPAAGLVVSMVVRRPITEQVHGHTLRTWVRHQLREIEDSLTQIDVHASPPQLQDDPTAPAALLSHYALPLPGGSLQVRARHWLSADGHGVGASCLCAGSGCTQPPSCTLPRPPADALTSGTILGADGPSTTLETTAGDARLQAPGHLQQLPSAVTAQLEASDAQKAPRRSGHRVQGLKGAEGSGVVLREATWCAEPPACDAETLAENRRKAEVASLRATGTLRSVETHANRHSAVPMYGFEIDQHDGFWTRTMFWNRAGAVQEVSCACSGLACAQVQRTCTVEPRPSP